jgi:uncharacterized membrane protein
MIKRLVKLISVCLLLVGTFPLQSVHGQPETPTSSAQVQILEQNADGWVLRVTVPSYELEETVADGNPYHQLQIPDASYTGLSGSPRLPVVNAVLGVPADAELSVDILDVTSEVLPGSYHLLPVPVPQPAKDEFSEGTAVYQPDAEAYASDANYPAELANIADDGWLRDQRLVHLAFYPFQYRPASGQLTWHSQLLVAVRFKSSQFPQALEPVNTEFSDNPFEPLLQRNLLNYEQALQWRAVPDVQPAPLSVDESQALSTRYKIVVDTDGLYHLTYADAVAAGFAGSDPRNWQLTNLGSTVAITVTGQEDGSFDLNDEVVFYGERFRGDRYAARYPDEASIFWLLDNCDKTYCDTQIAKFRRDAGLQMEKYTYDNVYWLNVGATRGARMSLANGAPTGLTPAAYYTATVRTETQYRWFTYPLIDAEVWFWSYMDASSSPQTFTFPITLTAVANVPVSATLRGAFVAKSLSDTVYPDHHTLVTFNSPPFTVQDVWWDGYGRQAFTATVPIAQVVEGKNNLNVTIYNINGVVQSFAFDWYEVAYPRRFVPVNDILSFSGSQQGKQAFRAGGFSGSNVWSLDLTSPLTPTLITNAAVVPSGSGTYTVTLEAASGLGHQFTMVAQSALKSPKAISAYTPPDLYASTNGADYIIIADPLYNTPAQQLATYRASQGLRSMVVSLNDVFNLFGDGIYNPLAIKNFLRYAYAHWQSPAPRYVVLVGDGHSDLHMYRTDIHKGLLAQTMPPYMIFTDSYQGDVDSANQLVTLVGNDILPDMMVGRLVVADAAQLQAVVNKIIAYEAQTSQPWQQRVMFLADDVPDPAGNFVAQADGLISNHIPAQYTVQRLYLNNYSPSSAITTDFINSLNNNGALFATYIGHGYMQAWASPTIFHVTNVPSLTNAAMLPIVFDMTCATGQWHNIYDNVNNQRSLAMELVRHPTGGAIATFSPTSRSVSTGHETLASGFFDAVFKDEVHTLGEAALGGVMNIFNSGYDYDIANTFVIFGDPALKLPSPVGGWHLPDVSASITQQVAHPGNSVSYIITVRNDGSAADTFTLSTQGNTWPVQLSQTSVGPLAPGAQAQVTVTVQVPDNASYHSTDTVNVTATSQGNINKKDTQPLTTQAHFIVGSQVTSVTAANSGLPGQTLNYTLSITNTGEYADTYSVEIISAWSAALVPAGPIGPIAPGESRTLTFSITIPAAAANGSANTASLIFRSSTDPAIATTSNFLATVYIPTAIAVTPPSAAQDGVPGQTITYHLQVTNDGAATDTFDVNVSSSWPVVLTPPGALADIPASASRSLTMSVTIPPTATNGSANAITLLFRSQIAPSTSVTVTYLANTRIVAGLQLTPAALSQKGKSGETIAYTLHITNTGNFVDTFTVTSVSNWGVNVTPTSVGPLEAGGAATLTVYVSIPAAAIQGQSNSTTITLRSQRDPTAAETTILLTNVFNAYRVYLPMIKR